MDLAPHLWTALAMGVLTVEMTFFPPVTIDQFATRKELAAHCYRVISEGVAASIAGRKPTPAAATSRHRPKRRVPQPIRVS
jgi:lyso-ornithine lipid O-acyltransferase